MRSWTVGVALALSATLVPHASAQEKTEFNLAWSIYVGWMPWGYAEEAGIVDRWAERYGITINLTQFNDYVEAINQYTAGSYDAVTITNMDALSIPAASGVDTTTVVINDFSNGNDVVILKDETDLAAIAGQRVHLVELSVSHYFLVRALESVGLTERDVVVVNTSDADMVGTFQTLEATAMATWNPQAATILGEPNANNVFDSSQIPGEIVDMTVAKTDILAANPDFGHALAGIWYETMEIVRADTPEGAAARAAMGAASGTDQAGFEAQLEATEMFFDPQSGTDFVGSPQMRQTMDQIRNFLFDRGLLGAGVQSPDAVGIEFVDGSVLGDEEFVRLRFSDRFMASAGEP